LLNRAFFLFLLNCFFKFLWQVNWCCYLFGNLFILSSKMALFVATFPCICWKSWSFWNYLISLLCKMVSQTINFLLMFLLLLKLLLFQVSLSSLLFLVQDYLQRNRLAPVDLRILTRQRMFGEVRFVAIEDTAWTVDCIHRF